MLRFAHVLTLLTLVLLCSACSDDPTPAATADADAGNLDVSTETDVGVDRTAEVDAGIPDEVEPGEHSAACTGHGECDGRTCLTERLLRWFEGGYCTEFDCDLDDPEACGDEAMCLEIMSGFPTTCVRSCRSNAQCREGHNCVGFCMPEAIAADLDTPDLLEAGDASIQAVVDGLDADRMLERLNILSGEEAWQSPGGPETIVSRAVGHPDHDVAAEYLVSLLEGMGYDVNRLTGVARDEPYENLEVVYVVHDAVARVVDQHTFFHLRESGGTKISSAYELCLQQISERYRPEDWNIYPFHFSDGDNWSARDTEICVTMLRDEILPRVNQFCYGQVKSAHGSGQFKKDLDTALGEEEILVTASVNRREDIPDAIRRFLGKGR